MLISYVIIFELNL